jgi:hypothetical protein
LVGSSEWDEKKGGTARLQRPQAAFVRHRDGHLADFRIERRSLAGQLEHSSEAPPLT